MNLFVELSIIIAVATILSFIARLLKQPLVVAYIAAGIACGPYLLNIVHEGDHLEFFSKMGIAILLFIVGLNLSPKVVKEVGSASVTIALGQVGLTTLLGFLLATLLGFSSPTSIYIAISLAFGSTIIVMKILSDRGDLEKLYGKISIGLLLIQDIIATLLLITVSSFSGEGASLFSVFGNGVAAIFILYCISQYVIPKIGRIFASSQEMLFLFSIAWGLGIASLFEAIGFSVEIGALAAGVILSMTPFAHEIGARMKPLRDFFVVIFFILLGSQMLFADLSKAIFPALALSLFVLIINPLIIAVLLNLLGYKRKTVFQAGLSVTAISEFSLILVALGASIGHVSSEVLSLITLVGLMTIAAGSYLMIYSEKVYDFVSPFLKLLEIRNNDKRDEKKDLGYEVALFGYDRVGKKFLESFRKLAKKFIVIDFNPDAIARLKSEGIESMYGDAEDIEFLRDLNLQNFKLAVSTLPDFRANEILVKTIRGQNSEAVIITIARDHKDAEILYGLGATYVVIPHHLGAEYAAKMISEYGFDKKSFEKERAKHKTH